MFAKDSRVENFLTRVGGSYSYTNDRKFEDLAPNWENVNLGRPRAKVDEAILEYAARTEAGSSAPAPILRKMSDHYDVLDGVQRLSAERLLGTTKFSAYVVTTDSEILARKIRVMANPILNGAHGPDAAWTRLQAVEILVIQGGCSVAEVARLGGWNPKSLEEDKTFLTWRYGIVCIGGPDLNKGVVLNIAAHAKLDDLRKAPKPIAAFCADLKTGSFSNGESSPVVEKFFEKIDRKKDLNKAYVERLEDFRSDPDVKARLEGRSSQRREGNAKLRASLLAVRTITEKLLRSKTRLVFADEYYHLLNQITANIKKLEGVAKARA